MLATISQGLAPQRKVGLLALLASPAVAIFLSNNAANAGNLIYNMLFSRWLGPETFGLLATILTLKLAMLALMNALQMAVSQQVSRGETPRLASALALLDRRLFIGLAAFALLLMPLAINGTLATTLGLSSNATTALALLLLALPVTAPLCVGRGIAMGRQQTGSIVASGQLEMGIRLLGGALAWQAGWGLTGIVAALVMSLVLGWFPVRRGRAEAANPKVAPTEYSAEMRTVLLLAVPFAILQAAQVALMDGDIVAASILLDHRDTGYVAVLGLFQRIQFFACFGLAAVLLPSVTAASARGESGLREMRPIVILFAATMLPLLAMMYAIPAGMIVAIAGTEFAGAAPALLPIGVAAAAFTGSYLMATLLAAWSDRRGLVLFALAVPVQFGSYALLASLWPDFELAHMMAVKAGVQLLLALGLAGLIAQNICNRATSKNA